MSDELFVEYTLEYIICIGVCILCIVCFILFFHQRYSKAINFKNHVQKLETGEWRAKYLERVREKINATQSIREKRVVAEDLVAQCIYNHDAVKQLGSDMKELFEKQYQIIQEQYPTLTSLDLLVLSLLSIELKNSEICSILRMERRTLYRRRQLIAQRIGISSSSLEDFAMKLLNE